MGKVSDWLIGMEEDAMWMSRDSWAAKHGASNLRVYDEVQEDMTGQRSPRRRDETAEMLQEQINRLEEIFRGKI
tara:strand:- start:667 stop:888 length:222 start_codon:yes stop_codon:yes gene_type:complete